VPGSPGDPVALGLTNALAGGFEEDLDEIAATVVLDKDGRLTRSGLRRSPGPAVLVDIHRDHQLVLGRCGHVLLDGDEQFVMGPGSARRPGCCRQGRQCIGNNER